MWIAMTGDLWILSLSGHQMCAYLKLLKVSAPTKLEATIHQPSIVWHTDEMRTSKWGISQKVDPVRITLSRKVDLPKLKPY
jgi:hypothetical protein